MKVVLLLLLLLPPTLVRAADDAKASRAARTVVLDETALRHLRLETAEAEEADFEETTFALGTIEAQPARRAVVASRVAGRVLEVMAHPGDAVPAGGAVLRLESRQPGDPPPTLLLRAPLAGVVARSEVRLGEPVDPDRALMEIIDLAEVLAVARVPDHAAGALPAGTKARIRIAGTPDRAWEATLARSAPVADRESGTLEAFFVLPNPDGLLRPGMRAEFTLVRSVRPGVRAVPRAALQGDGARRFVFVRDYELPNAFVRTPVATGAQNDRFVEIADGLLPGDEVVVRGAPALAAMGRGSVTLREALDAAHGHPHNEDGSEMTPAQIAAARATSGSAPAPRFSPLTVALALSTAVLLALQVIGLLRRRPA